MDHEQLKDEAKARGLGRALEECPDDVIAAALEAEQLRVALHAALAATLSPADEPWPPMRVPERRGE